jgi:hypothetical protein
MGMTGEQAPGRRNRSPWSEIELLLSMGVAAMLMVVIAAGAVAIAGPLPERLTLTGPAWHWTGTTAGDAPTVTVPDPDAYAIDFAGDRTFAGTADCIRVAGTYGIVTAGRAGGTANRLTMELGPPTTAACGPRSLADTFVGQLGQAAYYAIDGSQLVITLGDGSTMTFDAAPAAGETPVP